MFGFRFRPRAAAATGVLAVGLAAALAGCSPAAAPDPALWTSRALAAQLVIAQLPMSQLALARTWAAQDLGGITIIGGAPADLAAQLRLVRAASGGVPMLITSDEEGGQVQRLGRVIYPLPSALWMGTHWTPATITNTARAYGLRMKALGVDTELAPDSDLSIPGYYIASQYRAFSGDPAVVATDVKAWNAGMKAAGVLSVVKHWPGHGQATNTHLGVAVTPALPVLAARDMLPFNAAFAAGAPAVMVGHLDVPGLTGGLPATLSPAAYSYLRARTGANMLIMTDSMSMRGVTSALGQSPVIAALRALQAGADVVLTDDRTPFVEVTAIAHAIDTGAYPRTRALASVRRMLAAKRSVGDR
jgi:beta-N-acetylhexosaminidase